MSSFIVPAKGSGWRADGLQKEHLAVRLRRGPHSLEFYLFSQILDIWHIIMPANTLLEKATQT